MGIYIHYPTRVVLLYTLGVIVTVFATKFLIYTRICQPLDLISIRTLTANLSKICTNAQRQSAVKAVCDSHPDVGVTGPGNSQAFSHMLVDDKRHVIYCAVPGAASTAMTNLMMSKSRIRALDNGSSDNLLIPELKEGITNMSNFTNKARSYRIANYTKILIVRSPLARLHSAYNKIFIQDYQNYGTKYFKDILDHIYPPLSVINGKSFLSWKRFIDLIVIAREKEPFVEEFAADRHWVAAHKLCYPCSMKYDYILRTESLQEEIQPILAIYNVTEFPKTNSSDLRRSTNPFNYTHLSITEDFISLSSFMREAVYKLYAEEMDMFGYRSDPFNGPVCDQAH